MPMLTITALKKIVKQHSTTIRKSISERYTLLTAFTSVLCQMLKCIFLLQFTQINKYIIINFINNVYNNNVSEHFNLIG